MPLQHSDNESDLRPGTLVTRNLRLVRRLADGGMGSVWVADMLNLGTPVAVKFLRGPFARSPVALGRFRREAAAAAKIRSPHVVQILDFDVTAAGRPYIVMELLEGETLAANLARVGRLDDATTITVVRQLCMALAKAHELGVVHRDVKPENVYLVAGCGEPFVKVLDFGVAKDLTTATQTTAESIVGTPQFMAPEQMAGFEVAPSADVWAVGVLTHCCVTGQLPFDGETFVGMAAALEREARPKPSPHDPSVAPAIARWLDRALQPDPRKRFANARALLEAIDGIQTQASAAGGPSNVEALATPSALELGPTVRIRKRRATSRERRWLQVGVFAIALALVLGVWLQIKRAPRRADTPPGSMPVVSAAPASAAPSVNRTTSYE